MCKLEFLDKHLVSLLTVIVLVGMLFATSGCRTLDAACEDAAGTFTLLREVTAPLANKAGRKDADRNAKWLLIYQAKRDGLATIGYDPEEMPWKKTGEGK